MSEPELPVWHAQGELERMREEHRAMELSFRVLGVVSGLLALLLAAMLGKLAFDALAQEPPKAAISHPALLLLATAATVLQGWVSIGLYRLNPKVAGPAVLVFLPMVFSFPLGTLFGSYGLYALMSKRGRRVLSPGWKSIVAAADRGRTS